MDRSLSYPIGKHVSQASYSASERASGIARIAAQPAALAAALSGLSDAAYELPYRPAGWSVRQLVHHVADSHINLFIRVKFALSEDEPTIKPYDQDAWVTHADVATVPPMVSVALLSSVHERLVPLLRAMSPAQFSRGH